MEQRVNIKFCYCNGDTWNVGAGVREEAVSRKCVYEWFKRFREGKETIEDEPRSGRPSTSRTPEMIEKVRQMLAQDRRLTLRLIAEFSASTNFSLLIGIRKWTELLNCFLYNSGIINPIKYYGKIMEVIDALDSTDSSAVATVKSMPSEQLLEDNLFIDSNFKIVSKSITLLESSKLQLSEALNIVYNVSQTVIQNNNSLISEKVKFHDKTSEVGVLKCSDFPFLKYAPTTCKDTIVRDNLGKRKICSRFVPHKLLDEQKAKRNGNFW
ncbi:hypothetical protein ANN_00906 [Periplaneta americana]|uniref:Mos1 transposase HTH domain-containing protein n=1 Tax=Periplaneta americana TaxID=6978 RepID=A0ABQ8TUH3_PERAM|nr:hypothetical protein ANN_00906 [Periplaneta americana]